VDLEKGKRCSLAGRQSTPSLPGLALFLNAAIVTGTDIPRGWGSLDSRNSSSNS